MLRILHNTHIDFIRLRKTAAIVIALLIVPGIVMTAIRGFNYSVEFTGGTLMQVEFTAPTPPGIGDVRSALADAGLSSVDPSQFGSDREFAFKAQEERDVATQADSATSIASKIRGALDARFGAGSYVVEQTEAIGPKVGGELRRQAVVALLIAFGLTLIYLAWRFEWRFALAAVLATVHDIIATLAFMQYLNMEISLFVVGSILTVIGYSMNDKVVVFDRVRENLRKKRRESLYDTLNRSVNETLPRTVMTGSTTLASLLALLIFGGIVIRPFASILTFGIIIGTFSSIYVASPILLWIERKWPREIGDRGGVAGRLHVDQPRAAPTPKSTTAAKTKPASSAR